MPRLQEWKDSFLTCSGLYRQIIHILSHRGIVMILQGTSGFSLKMENPSGIVKQSAMERRILRKYYVSF